MKSDEMNKVRQKVIRKILNITGASITLDLFAFGFSLSRWKSVLDI